MAVVSKGDDKLLKVVGRTAWHFPQTVEGVYAGAHPTNSLAAIAHLEALRVKGADFLIFPSTAFWWLEHYGALQNYLQRRYQEFVRNEACVIFDLREPSVVESSNNCSTIQQVFDRLGGPYGDDRVILDWNTGLQLARTLTRNVVFSPPTADPILPYLDHSVDVVVVLDDAASIAEARRVAHTAVVTVTSSDATNPAELLHVEWQAEELAKVVRAISIICLVDEAGEQSDRRRAALRANLPNGFAGEILWLDPIDCDSESGRGCAEVTYAAACNRAAIRARGDVLIFLNRLTVPLEGWLVSLLDILDSQPCSGVVGGKVLCSDARLDQAGGVAFSDGSLVGFGNGDYMIDDPLYNYVRTVDYCSDAVLATTRSLFDELSGFDIEYFSPAYANADFCFRAREHGFRTYYQPDCLVVSIPVAADRDGSPRTIADLDGDRVLFGSRWSHTLKQQPLTRSWRDRDTWHALALDSEVSAEMHP